MQFSFSQYKHSNLFRKFAGPTIGPATVRRQRRHCRRNCWLIAAIPTAAVVVTVIAAAAVVAHLLSDSAVAVADASHKRTQSAVV